MNTLGRYEVLGELGAGSMGIIYRGRDSMLDRDVALKTIARAGSLDPELKERFYREARLCAKLNHPNIVTIYDLGEQDGTAFIAMELLEGCDFKRLISERRPMPLSRKVGMIAELCDGLHHAHGNGIIHRDIKPSNIFLNHDGVAKILDFGIARLPTSSLTMMGRVLGTPHYMAPEQMLGQPCGARSDLFSLAMVAFEFLTYAHPFAGESIPKRIMHDAPDSLLLRNPQLPAELEPVVAKALEKEPAKRYATLAEFAQGLRSVLPLMQGAETSATPVATAPPEPGVPSEVRASQQTSLEFERAALLAAIQEFDSAVEQKDPAKARASLASIEKVARSNTRFVPAFRESSERLRELEGSLSMPPAGPPQATAGTSIPLSPPPVAPMPSVNIPPGQGSSLQAGGEATALFGGPKPPPPPRGPEPPKSTVMPRPTLPVPSPPRVPALRPPLPPKAAAKSNTIIFVVLGVAALCFLGIAGGGIYWYMTHNRNAERVPALAAAVVSADQSKILAAPSDSARVVTMVKKGDAVNVIRPPQTKGQEWTQVQFIAGAKVFDVGSIKTADLDGWSSTKPDTALFLLQTFGPGEGGSEAELQPYVQRLNDYLKQFAGTPQEAEARTELDRVTTRIASLQAAQGSQQTAGDGQAAQNGQNPQGGQGATNTTPLVPPETLVQRAKAAWEQAEYLQAERYLRRALQQKPGFQPALDLLQKVEKAKKVEGIR